MKKISIFAVVSITDMKLKRKIVVLATVLACMTLSLSGQTVTSSNPSGTVIYSLPSTSINLVVTAVSESFTAGPYAKYAQKYLGTPARTQDETKYRLSTIDFAPYIEADPDVKVTINLAGKDMAAANFLQFCSQGLIITTDSYTGKEQSWRFPTIANNDRFAGKGVSGNLTNTTTTLYKTVNTESGFQRVAVQQSQVVEKSAEKKAEEIAKAIFKLREQRVQIITGDTDATFSGEALGAAIGEINRLEQEYLTLFFGITESSTQTMSFDVVPKEGQLIYVAFRLSDSQGLLPANNMGGRPIVLELTPDSAEDGNKNLGAPTQGKAKGQLVYYRTPATATAKIMDGQTLLMQTRVPVYQFGKTNSFPIETLISK